MTAQTPPLPTQQEENSAARFGTFTGVFTPNVLTILGLILFLRIGFITAHAGLWHTLIIVMLANLISFLTGLSLSAIATSMEVKAGGDYYIISRSLGLEVGGAIGIPLYLSLVISVGFYIIGFTESLQSLPIFAPYDPRVISTLIALLFIFIAWIGADFALKIQFFILTILVAALISFFAGGWDTISTPILTPQYGGSVPNFWVAFAIFFPAVTGISVGTSMSGDLKDPTKSIPQGTIGSILLTWVVYIFVVIWFAFHAPDRQELINNTLAIQGISIFPPLILAGVWASTLSSALGSIVAAPRTLQAIATDRVLPKWLASNLGHATEPRTAVLISGVFALAVIWLGDLNAVAPIISMFFLNTYAMTNLAAGFEKLIGNPSYRPRFSIPWYVSFIGAIGCYATMFLISIPATIAAIVISIAIYAILQRRRLSRTWGDVRTGFWFALARYALLNLEDKRISPKNWRPNLMVFTGLPKNRLPLAEVAKWLSQGHGIVTLFQFILHQGEITQEVQDERERAVNKIKDFIQENRIEAFAEVEIMPELRSGVDTVAQAHGVGRLDANTVLLGWSGSESGRRDQILLTRDLIRLRKSVLFLKLDSNQRFGNYGCIDVWWREQGGNVELMLLLAHLIRQDRQWGKAKIRLIRVLEPSQGAIVTETETFLADRLKKVRVNATPLVLVRDKDEGVGDVIQRESENADLTILGMSIPDSVDAGVYAERLDGFVSSVGTALLVRSAIEDENFLEASE